MLYKRIFIFHCLLHSLSFRSITNVAKSPRAFARARILYHLLAAKLFIAITQHPLDHMVLASKQTHTKRELKVLSKEVLFNSKEKRL